MEALAAFGSGRSMLGSDWPVSSSGPAHVGYDMWTDIVLNLAPEIDERHDIAWRTASRFYGLSEGAGQ